MGAGILSSFLGLSVLSGHTFRKNSIMKKIFTFLFLTVALTAWGQEQERAHTAAENVKVIEIPLHFPRIERERQIRIYLPPNYSTSKKDYDVLYMHDGQNLFDDATSFVGEWGVDEVLNELYKENGLELIVVGIDNGQEHRMQELTAWDHEKYGKAEGKEYMDFIVRTVKPYVDDHYRTLSSWEHTGIMGSSMGGLISHYAVFQYSGYFSKAGIFSPSYWYSEGPFDQAKKLKLSPETKLFLYMGGKEGPMMLDNFNRMVELLKEEGYADQMQTKITSNGEHNERFWRAELKEALLWLYSK